MDRSRYTATPVNAQRIVVILATTLLAIPEQLAEQVLPGERIVSVSLDGTHVLAVIDCSNDRDQH